MDKETGQALRYDRLVHPVYLLGLASLNLVVLLVGMLWATQIQRGWPGLALALPQTRFELPHAGRYEPILLVGHEPLRIYHEGVPMTVAELEGMLQERIMPRQFILLAEPTIPWETVWRLAEIGLLHGHEMAVGGSLREGGGR